MSSHRKIVKRSFFRQLLWEMKRYREEHKIGLTRVSAMTGFSETRIRMMEKSGCMTWLDLAKLLYFYDKWFVVKLVDNKQYVPHNTELEDN